MEIDFVDHYLALQRIRLADRLKIEKAIAPDAMMSLIPTMLLQPLVENAIKHGVSALRGPGSINITAECRRGELLVEVRDSGPGATST
jgi:sensor histidine kinase YesM